MGVPVLILVASMAHAQDGCPDRDVILDRAQEAIEEAALDQARQHLADLEKAMGCGTMAPKEQLARYFLLEGAASFYEGDADTCDVAFASARRLAPSQWIQSLGPDLLARFEATADFRPRLGEIVLEPKPKGYLLAIDGSLSGLPARVDEGLHVVQLGPSLTDIQFQSVLEVLPDGTHVITHPLLPVDEKKIEEDVFGSGPVMTRRTEGAAGLHLAAGPGLSIGKGLDGAREGKDWSEPAAKLSLPLEGGVQLASGVAWIRIAASVQPLIGGRYLYGTDEGDRSSVFGFGGNVGGGVTKGDLDIGGLLGMSWPGRATVRGIGAYPLTGDLRIEGRLGLDVGTGGRFEPAAAAMAVWHP